MILLNELDKSTGEAETALRENAIGRNTYDEKIAQIKETTISIHLENALKQANINKTHSEIDKISAEMVKWATELQNAGKQLDINETKMWIDGVIGGIGAIGNVMNIGKMTEILKQNGKGTSTVSTKVDKDGNSTTTYTKTKRVR